jgi:hypothetical protein
VYHCIVTEPHVPLEVRGAYQFKFDSIEACHGELARNGDVAFPPSIVFVRPRSPFGPTD